MYRTALTVSIDSSGAECYTRRPESVPMGLSELSSFRCDLSSVFFGDFEPTEYVVGLDKRRRTELHIDIAYHMTYGME